MGIFRRKNKPERRLRSVAGRSLSANSYYRPANYPSNEPRVKPETRGEPLARDEKPKRGLLKFGMAKAVNFLLIGAFIFLAIAATTLSSTPNMQFAQPHYAYRDDSEYQSKATELLRPILNRSKLLFRSSDYEQAMQQAFPEISAIEAITPLGGRNLTVAMRLSPPLAIAHSGNQSGTLDSGGVLATDDTNDVIEDDVFNLYFSDPQEDFFVGKRVLTETEVELLNLLREEAANFSYKGVDGLTIKDVLFSVRDGQFLVSFNEVPYKLKLSTYSDPAEQVGAFKATVYKLAGQNQLPAEYFDARVPGRVFVK